MLGFQGQPVSFGFAFPLGDVNNIANVTHLHCSVSNTSYLMGPEQ